MYKTSSFIILVSLFFNILEVKCYSYQRMKAYTVDGRVECLSECTILSDQNDKYCMIDYQTKKLHRCDISDERGTIYYTSGATGHLEEQPICSGECGIHGYQNYWCFIPSGWDYCSPNKDLSAYGNKCLDECEFKNSGKYECMVSRPNRHIELRSNDPDDDKIIGAKYDPCSPPPVEPDYIFDKFYLFAINENVLHNVGTCIKTDRNKRQSESDVRNIGVEELADAMEDHYRRYVRNPTGSRRVETAVTRYTYLPAPPVNRRIAVRVPLVVRARITHDIVTRARRRNRLTMPSRINHSMTALDRVPNDERGHILADSLGGTVDLWNIVPQSRICNRNAGRRMYWFPLEEEIRNFTLDNPNSAVDWTCLLAYDDLTYTRRPTAFGLRARFYDGNHQVRDTGNCYFSNDPNGGSFC